MVMAMDVALASERGLPEAVTVSSQTAAAGFTAGAGDSEAMGLDGGKGRHGNGGDSGNDRRFEHFFHL